MAIIIEEEKRIINWFAVLVVMAILIIIGVVAYYLFFVKPESINVIVPAPLVKLNESARIKFVNPAEIIDKALKNLNNYAPLLEPEPAFNPNPFSSYGK